MAFVVAARSLEDNELLQRSLTEEPRVFGTLVERHAARVLGYLLRRTGDSSMAEDLVQETFLRAYRARRGWRSEGSALGWLLTIARHLLLSRVKHHRRWRIVPLDIVLESGLQSETGVPEETIIRRERQDAVRREVLRLPRHHRDVIVLSVYGELRYAEMAELMGTTETRVRQRAYHARQVLRGRLSEMRQSRGVVDGPGARRT